MIAGCGPVGTGTTPAISTPAETSTPPAPEVLTVSQTPSPQPPAPTDTSEPTWTFTPISTPTITATPDPYSGLTIADLSSRTYGGGEVVIDQLDNQNKFFTRYLFSYPSDGLTIRGFMNVPQGEGPFPVVIALHGYIDPDLYTVLDYTAGYANDLARAGFLVLHPTLRNFPPSDNGPDRFRVGMAVDVLNLIALVKAQGGQPGALQMADASRIGLWGHSMGGGITIRTLTLSPEVKAAVLYGAMGADDQKNYERIYHNFSNQQRGVEELATAPQDFARISPVGFLDRITAAVSIHHGEDDTTVPLAWSKDLCQRLKELGKTVECFWYPDEPHTFSGDGNLLFMQRVIEFFNRYLR